MLIFLVVILLLAALLEYLSLRGGLSCVDADFDLSVNRTETDAPVALTTTVRNTGLLPISYGMLRITFPLSAALPEGSDVRRDPRLCTLTDVFRLWGHRSVERTIRFEMQKRGVYAVSGRELARGDFLGLQLVSGRFDARRSLLVYPPRLESAALMQALGAYTGLLSAQRWLIRDPVLTLGVREYTGQEPMRTISWSQTARRGELTVREFDFTRSMNCCVILLISEQEAGESDLLDRCCGAVRTICEALLESGVEAQLYTNAALIGYPMRACRSVTAVQNREEDLLEVLARVTDTPCSDAEKLVDECLDAQADATACVLVTLHEDEQAQTALRLLNARAGMGALLVAVDTLEVD